MGNAAPNPSGSDVCVSVDMTSVQFDPMSVWAGTLPRYPQTGGIQHLVTDLLVAARLDKNPLQSQTCSVGFAVLLLCRGGASGSASGPTVCVAPASVAATAPSRIRNVSIWLP